MRAPATDGSVWCFDDDFVEIVGIDDADIFKTPTHYPFLSKLETVFTDINLQILTSLAPLSRRS